MSHLCGSEPPEDTRFQVVVSLWEFLQGLKLALSFTSKVGSRYALDCVEVKVGEDVDCLVSSSCGSVFVSSKLTRKKQSIGSPMCVLLQSEEVSRIVDVVCMWEDYTNKVGLCVQEGNLVISGLKGEKCTSTMNLIVESYKGHKQFVDLSSVKDKILRSRVRVEVTVREYLTQVVDLLNNVLSPVTRESFTNLLSCIRSDIKTVSFVVSKGCLFLKGDNFSLCLGIFDSKKVFEVETPVTLVDVDPRLLYSVVKWLVGDIKIDMGGLYDPLWLTDEGGHTIYMMGVESEGKDEDDL